MFENLTVITPIRETEDLTEWYRRMSWLLGQAKWLIVDSGGGNIFNQVDGYQKVDVDEWTARDLAIAQVKTPITVFLDAFNILPEEYVNDALNLIESDKADCCAIDYEESIGHYGFGTSVWRTKTLREIYDYPAAALKIRLKDDKGEFHVFKYTICECIYVWNRLYMLLYKAQNIGEPQHG